MIMESKQEETAHQEDQRPEANGRAFSYAEFQQTERKFSTAEFVDGKLFLCADEAYERAITNPQDTRPVYIIYGPNDKANPRNWGKARKWYITVLVSLANVFT